MEEKITQYSRFRDMFRIIDNANDDDDRDAEFWDIFIDLYTLQVDLLEMKIKCLQSTRYLEPRTNMRVGASNKILDRDRFLTSPTDGGRAWLNEREFLQQFRMSR